MYRWGHCWWEMCVVRWRSWGTALCCLFSLKHVRVICWWHQHCADRWLVFPEHSEQWTAIGNKQHMNCAGNSIHSSTTRMHEAVLTVKRWRRKIAQCERATDNRLSLMSVTNATVVGPKIILLVLSINIHVVCTFNSFTGNGSFHFIQLRSVRI